jgi:hypothetical protein
LQRSPRHHEDLPRLNDAGRQIHPLTGQQIQLTQEAPRTVASNDPFLAVGTEHDLGCTRADHVEVVGGVPLSVEILAHGHRPPGPECLENGKLGVIECGKRDGVVSQGHMRAHGFDLLLTSSLIAKLPPWNMGWENEVLPGLVLTATE